MSAKSCIPTIEISYVVQKVSRLSEPLQFELSPSWFLSQSSDMDHMGLRACQKITIRNLNLAR